MDRLIGVLIAAASVAGAIAVKLVLSEIEAWLPNLAHHLIKQAIKRFPEQERERRREEWLADSDDYPGKITKLWHAIGCVVASYRMIGNPSQQLPNSSRGSCSGAVDPWRYRILVWVAADLEPSERQAFIEIELRRSHLSLDELNIPEQDRMVEIRVMNKSTKALVGLQVFSQIWSASIDV